MNEKQQKQALIILLIIWILGTILLAHELNKARLINKVFSLWFQTNLGITLNLDKLYEDGKKYLGGYVDED